MTSFVGNRNCCFIALLLLLLTIKLSMAQSDLRVAIHRVVQAESAEQLSLMCEAAGSLVGLSARLYCLAGGSLEVSQPMLCFENCARTPACLRDRLCATAECSKSKVPVESALLGVKEGFKTFRYDFLMASSDAAAKPHNLTFECRYGWQSSRLLIANDWRAAATQLSTAGSPALSGIRSLSSPAPTRRSKSLPVPPTTIASDAFSAVVTADTAQSAGTTSDAPGAEKIDKSHIYLAGFIAVALLSVAVLVTVVTYLLACRRPSSGSSSGKRTADGKKATDTAEDAAKEQLMELPQQRKPDLLPGLQRRTSELESSYSLNALQQIV